MFLVTGATGKTGSAVMRHLLERGSKVRAYVRSEEKARPIAARGLEVAVGTLEDESALTDAMRGTKAVYLMQPNDFESTDFIEDGRKRARVYLRAARTAGVDRVVGLSSIGAQHSAGTGPAVREHHFEQIFARFENASFVRPSYFMENWANVLDAVLGRGILPTFLAPNRMISMVAVDDIGLAVARLLAASSGPRVTEFTGPTDYSPAQVAEALAMLLGRRIDVVPSATDEVVPLFEGIGFSRHIAKLVREMYEGYASGQMAFHRKPERGQTTLEAVLGQILCSSQAQAGP